MTEQHKSAITDHVAATNHTINWEEAKVIDREPDRNVLDGSKKPFGYLKKGKQTLNQDEGAYKLHNTYNQLILTTPTKATPPICKGAVMSGLGCQSDEAARVAVKRH